MSVLVTGGAGFIGMHVCQLLLQAGEVVVAVDNLNDHYDVNLKKARLAQLESYPGFRFVRLDIADRDALSTLFSRGKSRQVVHPSAQAGVRYSQKSLCLCGFESHRFFECSGRLPSCERASPSVRQ